MKARQHLLTAKMLYTLENYSAALTELEQANALVPNHYAVLHLRNMCKAALEQYEDAISDLTGRAHYCNALFSRGMCHLSLGNHEKGFDDILRADILDSRSGDSFLGSMKFAAVIDPGDPRIQKSAELCAALKRRKMNSLKVMLSLHAPSCWSVTRHKFAIDTTPSSLASSTVCVVLVSAVHTSSPLGKEKKRKVYAFQRS